jgi:hypothetical protein
MSYTNQCHYMKVSGDDGNPANGPDIIDVDPNAGVQGFSPSDQPTTLPTRERSHTGPYMPSHGLVPHPPFAAYVPSPDMDVGSSNDLSGTSPDGPSNRPTPNSSTTGASSEQQRQNLAAAAANGHVTGGAGGSGRNSFETSPVSSHQNLSSMSGTTPSDVEPGVNAFFGDPSSFGMTGLTPDSRFGMPGGAAGTGDASGGRGGGAAAGGGGAEFVGHAAAAWAEMAGQQGMTPVAEGMLRSIMAMGPMEGMDMGWEPNA